MILGIDASNLRAGGGLTHLTNLLRVAQPDNYNISEVVVWAGKETLNRLPAHPWLQKVHEPELDRPLPFRLLWQWRRLPKLASQQCDLLFAPGGNSPTQVFPLVTMSRNLLPFEWKEMRRYGISLMGLRVFLLRFGQSRTLRSADGVVFLTQYSREVVTGVVGSPKRTVVIPHGVEDRFRIEPRPQRDLVEFSRENPMRLVYVSIVDVYKHQWIVAEAVSELRLRGYPVAIEFVGPAYPAALARLRATLARVDPNGEFASYDGPLPFDRLHEVVDRSDIFVFASSCENMPNILLEGMAQGYPIACSNRGPMPEVLGDAGVYFDPENVDSVVAAIERLVVCRELRERCAASAWTRAETFSWERCADETLRFLSAVYLESQAT